MKSKTRKSAWEWSELVTAWEASGQSALFAREREVTESALRRWKAELARRARRGIARRPPSLARVAKLPIARVVREGEAAPTMEKPGSIVGEVAPVASEHSNRSIALMLDGVRVVVLPGFDAKLLRDVVRALSSQS